jgi:hypothetical protein
MGLFDFFKKKATDTKQPEKQNGEGSVDKNLYLLNALRLRLAEMGYQVERHPQYLALIVNAQVEIATMVIDEPGSHPSILHLMVAASHPQYFPKGIIENVVGIGLSLQDQVKSVLDNYINSTFSTIVEGFSDSHNQHLDFKAITGGKEVLWHPKLGNLSFQGTWREYPQNEPLFGLLKEKIPGRLTLNKINWLKIYISKRADGTIIGECLFNNEQWDAGSNLISEYAKGWKLNGEFQAIKQFIVFRKCDAYDEIDD